MLKMDRDEKICFFIVLFFSLTSKLPFININLLLPFNIIICYFCVIFNIISWFLLEVWALGLDLKFYILKFSFHTFFGFFKLLFIILISIFSQLPNVYPAIEYNDKKYSIYIAISVSVALSFFPIKSFILFFEYLSLSHRDRQKFQKFKDWKKYYLNKDVNFKHEHCEEDPQFISPNLIKENFNFISFIISPIIICIYCIFIILYSFEKTKIYIYDSFYVGFFVAFFVFITNFYLTSLIVFDNINFYFNLYKNFFVLNLNSYEYSCFKFEYFFLQIFCFFSSIFSVGVYYVVVTNFFIQIYWKIMFTVVCCFVIFTILQTGSKNMINYFFEYFISRYGNENDNKILKYNQKIRNFTFEEYQVLSEDEDNSSDNNEIEIVEI